eukprot:499560-Hanusia_phi.AAC.4
MRASALSRKKLPVLIEGSFDINKLELDQWLSLHSPLPLGFASLPVLSGTEGSKEESSNLLCKHVAQELARRMLQAEPRRWANFDQDSLVDELDLLAVAHRYILHYLRIMAIERKVYADATYQIREISHPVERAQPYLDEFKLAMEELSLWSANQPIPSDQRSKAEKPGERGVGMGMGMGMGMGKANDATSKKKAKKKSR